MLSCLVGDEGAWRQLWAWLPEWSQIKHPNMVFRATSNGYKSVLVLATGHSSWRCPPSPLSLPLSSHSLNSLYHKAGDRSPLILLVKTNKDEVRQF